MSTQTTTGGSVPRKVPPSSVRGAAMRGVVARSSEQFGAKTLDKVAFAWTC